MAQLAEGINPEEVLASYAWLEEAPHWPRWLGYDLGSRPRMHACMLAEYCWFGMGTSFLFFWFTATCSRRRFKNTSKVLLQELNFRYIGANRGPVLINSIFQFFIDSVPEYGRQVKVKLLKSLPRARPCRL